VAPGRAQGEGGAGAARAAGLVARARAGDRAALSALLGESRPRALAVALKVLRNAEDAEDAVQDAFVKVWRYLDRFEGRSSFTTWLHRIVMNACLDLLRHKSCRPNASDAEPAAPGAERAEAPAEPEPGPGPETALVAAQTGALVRRALEVLTPVHRQALSLRELDGSSYEEIATACACPVGTVMSRLHHARRRFAEVWQHVLEQAGESSDLLPCAA
jgi:RNA polymerase sigma-70 factor (ECF subfamily)